MILTPPLKCTKSLVGKKIHATDGTIGHVHDFYFDDQSWMVRYLVVDTGSWLTGRQVLLSADAFGEIGTEIEILKAALSRRQIEESPSIGSHLPISRQYEEEYYSYYGWPTYWGGVGMGYAETTYPATVPLPEKAFHSHKTEAHLQSVHDVRGYHIKATDGDLGYVDSFLFGSQDWQIRKIVVKTGVWNLGKEIHLFPEEIKSINYEKSFVEVRLSKAKLSNRNIK